jgi:hypothetical protein
MVSDIPPTSTPKPTWTMKPHGTLKACIYYEGELVDLGYLTFKNEHGRISSLYTELVGGCKDVFIPPGSYEIVPHYYQGACSDSSAICRPEEIYKIDISIDEEITIDFEVFLPE